MKLTRLQLEQQVTRLEHELSVHEHALRAVITDGLSEATRTANTHDFRYTLKLYRSQWAHGGVVVIRAKCLTNTQRDTIITDYLDSIGDRYPYEYSPAVAIAISELKATRQGLADARNQVAS